MAATLPSPTRRSGELRSVFSKNSAFFDTIQNFRDKLSVTDAVFREVLPNAHCLSEWTAMHNKLTRLAKRRNKIAHAHIVQLHVGEKMQLFASPPLSKIPAAAAFIDADRRRIFETGINSR